MRILTIILTISLVVISSGVCSNAAQSSHKEFYVALEGNDSNPGTLEKPFATLEQARDAIRHLKREGEFTDRGATVWIRGGTYKVKDTFKLTEEDSGSKNAPIVYRAYLNEDVRFSGGQSLKQEWFVPVSDKEILGRIIDEDARNRLLKVSLKGHGITDYGELSRHGFVINEGKLPQMELYIDGEHMKLARWPNEDYVTVAEIIDEGPRRGNDDFWQRGGTFRYDFDRPELWDKADDIWLAGSFRRVWEWTFKKVAEIDTQSKIITFRAGEYSGLSLDVAKEVVFYAQNLLEEIDVPGEYYIDRKTGILYLLPPESFISGDSDIMVSMLKVPMMELRDVSYVTFRDIIFDNGRSTAMNCNGGANVRIEQCEVRNFSNGGISLVGTNHGVYGCHIHHIGGSVIRIRGGDLMTLVPGNNVVENCHIHHFSHWNKVYNPGISMSGVGNRVIHCVIHDGTHMGIQLSGNDHLIEYNEFYRVPQEVWDMAAIYAILGSRPQQRGTVIRRNFFHHIGLTGRDKQACVYPDNMTMGWLVEENVFYKIGTPGSRACWSVMNHGGSYINTRNNMFIDCTNPYTMAFCLNSYFASRVPSYLNSLKELFEKNDFANMPHGKKYPELLLLLEEDRVFPDTNIFERNLIYNPTTPREFEGGYQVTYGPRERLQARNNWVAEQDPGFVDLEEMNFSLRSDAAAFKEIHGFKEIPFDEIGLSGAYGPFFKNRINRTADDFNK
ncbi:right-handed parallel beta-helix repeat-containing protein [Planctomycetota bacterium]